MIIGKVYAMVSFNTLFRMIFCKQCSFCIANVMCDLTGLIIQQAAGLTNYH